MAPAVTGYMDFEHMSTPELEEILGPLDAELQPGADGDYFLPEELSIQQRQQEDLSHGTPISGAQTSYVGGTAKANPPKNSGAVLPAYCDPPNPCPIGYTTKDGCISLEDFENTSEFSREFQSRQNCLCDSEHMFNCPAEGEDKVAAAGQNPAFLAGMPPSLE